MLSLSVFQSTGRTLNPDGNILQLQARRQRALQVRCGAWRGFCSVLATESCCRTGSCLPSPPAGCWSCSLASAAGAGAGFGSRDRMTATSTRPYSMLIGLQALLSLTRVAELVAAIRARSKPRGADQSASITTALPIYAAAKNILFPADVNRVRSKCRKFGNHTNYATALDKFVKC